jgi:hypothetical protein
MLHLRTCGRLLISDFALPHVRIAPKRLVFFISVSFLLVLVPLLAISAQPVILRLVLFFYSTSPFSRRTMTRGWYRGTSLVG